MDSLDDLREEIKSCLWRWGVFPRKPKVVHGGQNKGEVKYLPKRTIKRASLSVLATQPQRTLAEHQEIAAHLQLSIDDGSSPIDIQDVSQHSLEIVLKLIDYVDQNRKNELIPFSDLQQDHSNEHISI